MRKAAVLLVTTLTVLIFVGVSLMQSLLIIQRVAGVSGVNGMVKVRPQGQNAFLPLGDRTHVKAGDLVQTGEGGGVTLNWADGSRIRLGAATTMEVLKCQLNKGNESEAYLFKLDVGDIWVRVLKSLTEQSKFEIRTPTATAGVRGTVFSVSVKPDGATSVAVFHGKVKLATDSQELAIAERQVGTVGSDRRGQVRSISAPEQAQWERNQEVARPAVAVEQPVGDKLLAGATEVVVKGVANEPRTSR